MSKCFANARRHTNKACTDYFRARATTIPSVGGGELTFDDSPQNDTTEAALTALSDECVKTTAFSIGEMAFGYPEIIREAAAQMFRERARRRGNVVG